MRKTLPYCQGICSKTPRWAQSVILVTRRWPKPRGVSIKKVRTDYQPEVRRVGQVMAEEREKGAPPERVEPLLGWSVVRAADPSHG
jgi:hypothetical protein